MFAVEKSRVKVSRDITAPHKLVWQCITDTHKWCEWGPSVSAVQCEHQCINEHSTGSVKTVFGIWLPFEITSYEEYCSWQWRVGGIDATGHMLENMKENGVRLTFDMPFWAVAYLIVCYSPFISRV